MDYDEHNSTYSLFLLLMKWGVILNVALLIALSIGFFTPAGIIGGMASFVAFVFLAKVIL